MGNHENMIQVMKKFQLYDLALLSNHVFSNVSLMQAQVITVDFIQRHTSEFFALYSEG